MRELDLQGLGASERQALATSFVPTRSQRGMRNLVLTTLVTLTALAVFSVYGLERLPIAAMAILVIAVLVSEKISYFREIRTYRSLVRGLALRVEQLQATEPRPEQAFTAGDRGSRRT